MAARGSGESARRALGELYRLYFYPVFQLFAARRGHQYAGELTHAFFAERWALAGELASFDPDRAPRFRHWLLKSAHYFFLNRVRFERQKVRDERLRVSFEDAPPELFALPDPRATPERACLRHELLGLLSEVLQQLRDEYRTAANGQHDAALQAFEAMKPYLGGNELTAAECRALARELGIEANAAKQRVHRLRQRYSELLCRSAAVQYGFDDVDAGLHALRESVRTARPTPPSQRP